MTPEGIANALCDPARGIAPIRVHPQGRRALRDMLARHPEAGDPSHPTPRPSHGTPCGSDEPRATRTEPMSRKQAREFDEPGPSDDEREASEGSRGSEGGPGGAMNELIRRMAALGLSSFFTTESAIRRAFGDTVPKDWVDFANEQSERTRREVIDRMAHEFGKQLAEVDLAELISQFLTSHTVEINARVKLTPRKDSEPGPGVRTRVEFDAE